MPVRFLTSVYGDRHVNMVLPLLYSIEQSNPKAKVSVYWQAIQQKTIDLLQTTFPAYDFVETDFNFSADITKRISSKTAIWEQAALNHTGETVCFMDTDMLVIKPLADILSKSFDVLITDQKGRFTINSGLIVAHNTPEVSRFFTAWRKKTEEVLDDPDLFKQSNSLDLPYGGADQMAMHLLVGYTFGTEKYAVKIEGKTINVHTIPCRVLNETQSRPITKDTHVIHYKGGWRAILFSGGYFTQNRPKAASWQMYRYYIQTHCAAVEKVNKMTGQKFKIEDFGLSIPFYINPKTLNERPGLYPVFFGLAWLRALPSRIATRLKALS